MHQLYNLSQFFYKEKNKDEYKNMDITSIGSIGTGSN